MPEIQNRRTITDENAKNPFMRMSKEELLEWKRQNPQVFQGQGQGQNAMEILRGVGDIWSGGKSYTFDPQTGRPFAVETGVKRPATGGDMNAIIQKAIMERQVGRAMPTASEELAQRELENIRRRQPIDITGAGAPTPMPMPTPTAAPSAISPIAEPIPTEAEAPSQFITVMKWDTDKVGNEYQRPETVANPEYTKYLETKQFKSKEEEKILTKGKQEQALAQRNFGKVSALMQNLVGRWKGAAAEKTGVPGGLPALARGGYARAARENLPHTRAYPGQRIETAMAMSRIITGGARIIRSVINKLMETLPEDDAQLDVMRAKVAQTLTNAYRLSVGRALTSEENDFINQEVEKILQVPAIQEAVTSRPTEQDDFTQMSDEELRRIVGGG